MAVMLSYDLSVTVKGGRWRMVRAKRPQTTARRAMTHGRARWGGAGSSPRSRIWLALLLPGAGMGRPSSKAALKARLCHACLCLHVCVCVW